MRVATFFVDMADGASAFFAAFIQEVNNLLSLAGLTFTDGKEFLVTLLGLILLFFVAKIVLDMVNPFV